MIKNNKIKLIISSIIMLLPVFAGLLMWNSLPDKIVTHWGISGEPDGWSSKAFTIFFIPLFLFVLHWICVIITSFVLSGKDVGKKAIDIVLWICPVLSIVVMSLVYATALGMNINIGLIFPLLFGAMFAIIGNYLPKVKRNRVIGIRIPWTLKSDENWYHTHRLGGIVWVIGGLLMMLTGLLQMPEIAFAIIFVLVLIPTIYSYVYYLKNEKK